MDMHIWGAFNFDENTFSFQVVIFLLFPPPTPQHQIVPSLLDMSRVHLQSGMWHWHLCCQYGLMDCPHGQSYPLHPLKGCSFGCPCLPWIWNLAPVWDLHQCICMGSLWSF